AFQKISEISPRVATGIGRVGKAAGGLLVFSAAAGAVMSFLQASSGGTSGVERATAAMLRMGDGADELDAIFAKFSGGGLSKSFDDLEGSMEFLIRPGFFDRFNDVAGEV